MSSARGSSAHSTTSTLRPRTKHLISGLDGGDDSSFDSPNAAPLNRIASPVPSFDSRSASPIPAAHPQRSPNARRNNGLASNGSPNRAVPSRTRKPALESPSLWNALQGLASDFLGSDLSTDLNGKQRVRRPMDRLAGDRPTKSAPTIKWGPTAPRSHPSSGGIGAGTREEQAAEFRARKRKDMLTGQEASYADAMGKFKRRLSDARESSSAPPIENEDRDALVYLHHVKKEDTLAGITIRYNIPANVLRKANGMWPNDAVQVRQTLLLPVDACGVKGTPTTAPEAPDLVGSESESLSTLQAVEVPAVSTTTVTPLPNGSVPRHTRDRTNSASTHTTSSVPAPSVSKEHPWQHDSWVMLRGHTEPTQIARLPRRGLGYFPPARRKSNSYSDFDTPSTSLDLVRSASSSGTQAAVQPPASPLRQTLPRSGHRGRRPSNATNGYFPSYLTGPGGVGTMNKNVRFPGPAQDGLNKMFARHLPDVAPPRNQDVLYQPELPLYTDDPGPAGSGSVTPAFPHSTGGGSLNLNLENVGGAIESWVRRMASKAHTPGDRQPARRVSAGTPGKGAGGIGDLIEMTDEFEIGGDDDADEDRGRKGSPDVMSAGVPSSTATSYFEGATVRGRGGPVTRGKSGKAD